MEGATAAHDRHLVHVADEVRTGALGVQDDATVDVPTPQPVADGVGLLADLLVHERGEPVLLGGLQIPVDDERPPDRRLAVVGQDAVVTRGRHDDLILTQLDRPVGAVDECHHVTGQEPLAVADPEHQR